jgi:hypothetical protein
VCTADLGFTGGKNDIGAGTYTDFIGACTPALRLSLLQRSRHSQSTIITEVRGVMRQMSSWMLFLINTARFSATLSRFTASEVRVTQSRPTAATHNY